MVPPAPRECNQPACSVLHRKQSAHRNQLAAPVSAHATATSSPRLYLRMQLQPARRAQPARAHRRARRASPSQLCTRFAVLCAGFIWFVVLTFPKFNLYTLRMAILSCVRSSVGTELGNLAQCPGFESGRKFSDFFYFRRLRES